jgi:hypothetical protein
VPLSEAEELELLRLRKQKSLAATPPAPPPTPEEPGLLDQAKDALVSGAKQFGRAALDTATGDPMGMRRVLRREGAEGPVDAFRRGVIEAGTLGFSDELAGAQGWAEGKNYTYARDEARAVSKKVASENPLSSTAGQLAGGFAVGGVAGGGRTALARMGQAALMGGVTGAGTSEAGDARGVARDAAVGAGVGGALQGGVETLSPVGRFIRDRLASAGTKLRGAAGDLAERATGATRVQAEKFRPGAGQELLERGVVRFGDTPENVAQRAGQVRQGAEKEIDSVLSQLDDQGVTVSRDQLLADLHGRISQMRGDESKAGVVKKLEAIAERLSSTPQHRPISEVERVKRGYQSQSKYGNYAKPLTTEANKTAANVYRGAVEDVATAADPSLAGNFKEAKDTYGLIAPIEEAAARRAQQLNQHPMGGLLDVAAAGAGAAASGGDDGSITNRLKGAALGVVGRRVISPRLASSSAVATNVAGKALERLRSSPAGTRFVAPLMDAASRGGSALSVTHYIMSQRYPEYRKLTDDEKE